MEQAPVYKGNMRATSLSSLSLSYQLEGTDVNVACGP